MQSPALYMEGWARMGSRCSRDPRAWLTSCLVLFQVGAAIDTNEKPIPCDNPAPPQLALIGSLVGSLGREAEK